MRNVINVKVGPWLQGDFTLHFGCRDEWCSNNRRQDVTITFLFHWGHPRNSRRRARCVSDTKLVDFWLWGLITMWLGFRNNQTIEGPVKSRWRDVIVPPPHALRGVGEGNHHSNKWSVAGLLHMENYIRGSAACNSGVWVNIRLERAKWEQRLMTS